MSMSLETILSLTAKVVEIINALKPPKPPKCAVPQQDEVKDQPRGDEIELLIQMKDNLDQYLARTQGEIRRFEERIVVQRGATLRKEARYRAERDRLEAEAQRQFNS